MTARNPLPMIAMLGMPMRDHEASPAGRNSRVEAYAAVFDVDGVLIDSYQAHLASWLALARETDVAFTETDFASTFGQTSREIIARFWHLSSHDQTSIRALDDRKEHLYRQIIQREFRAMPGAAALIDALHGSGFRIAAGSSGPPENIELALEMLGRRDRFNAVITGHDVAHGKPDPQVFKLASDRLRVRADRCCVIEDAPAGIEAAHRAGMACIALASTGRRRDDLRHADLVIDSLLKLSPSEIVSIIGFRTATAQALPRDRQSPRSV